MFLIKDKPNLVVNVFFVCLGRNICDALSDSGANLIQWHLLEEELSTILNIVVIVTVRF